MLAIIAYIPVDNSFDLAGSVIQLNYNGIYPEVAYWQRVTFSTVQALEMEYVKRNRFYFACPIHDNDVQHLRNDSLAPKSSHLAQQIHLFFLQIKHSLVDRFDTHQIDNQSDQHDHASLAISYYWQNHSNNPDIVSGLADR